MLFMGGLTRRDNPEKEQIAKGLTEVPSCPRRIRDVFYGKLLKIGRFFLQNRKSFGSESLPQTV